MNWPGRPFYVIVCELILKKVNIKAASNYTSEVFCGFHLKRKMFFFSGNPNLKTKKKFFHYFLPFSWSWGRLYTLPINLKFCNFLEALNCDYLGSSLNLLREVFNFEFFPRRKRGRTEPEPEFKKSCGTSNLPPPNPAPYNSPSHSQPPPLQLPPTTSPLNSFTYLQLLVIT